MVPELLPRLRRHVVLIGPRGYARLSSTIPGMRSVFKQPAAQIAALGTLVVAVVSVVLLVAGWGDDGSGLIMLALAMWIGWVLLLVAGLGWTMMRLKMAFYQERVADAETIARVDKTLVESRALLTESKAAVADEVARADGITNARIDHLEIRGATELVRLVEDLQGVRRSIEAIQQRLDATNDRLTAHLVSQTEHDREALQKTLAALDQHLRALNREVGVLGID